MIQLPISAHPDFPQIKRVATVLRSSVNWLLKEALIVVEVRHFNPDDTEHKYLKAILCELSTHNQKYVDAAGMPVYADQEGNLPAGATPEFDFLDAALSSGQMTFHLAHLFMIQRNDQRGNFNDDTFRP